MAGVGGAKKGRPEPFWEAVVDGAKSFWGSEVAIFLCNLLSEGFVRIESMWACVLHYALVQGSIFGQ